MRKDGNMQKENPWVQSKGSHNKIQNTRTLNEALSAGIIDQPDRLVWSSMQYWMTGLCVWCSRDENMFRSTYIYGGFLKWWYPKMDG